MATATTTASDTHEKVLARISQLVETIEKKQNAKTVRFRDEVGAALESARASKKRKRKRKKKKKETDNISEGIPAGSAPEASAASTPAIGSDESDSEMEQLLREEERRIAFLTQVIGAQKLGMLDANVFVFGRCATWKYSSDLHTP